MPERHDEPSVALQTPRHTCFGCGACCFGHRVKLDGADELDRVTRHGASLGLDRPVVDGELRFDRGRCVFLSDTLRCRIHETFGSTEKPRVCQQYPLRSVRADGPRRVGVDPGCATAWRSFEDGEIPEFGETYGVTRDVSPPEAAAETALLRATSAPGVTVGGLVHLMAGSPGGTGLPDGYGHRLATRLRGMRLGPFLASDELGDGVRRWMAHLPEVFDGLDPDHPPAFALGAEADRFAVHVVRSLMFLRLGAWTPLPQMTMIHGLAGAVACAWADPRPERFGPALSTWTKLLRQPAFWLRLTAQPQDAIWLATGRG